MKKLLITLFLLIVFINFRLMYLKESFFEAVAEYLILSVLLICISAVDLEKEIIPDSTVALMIMNRLAYIILFETDFSALLSGLFTGFLNAAVMLLAALMVYRRIKKMPVGLGDVKLMFAIGLYFDPLENQMLIVISCLCCLSAFVIIKRKDRLPFGPFISFSALMILLYKSALSV